MDLDILDIFAGMKQAPKPPDATPAAFDLDLEELRAAAPETETQRCLALPQVTEYPEAAALQERLRRPGGTWVLNEIQGPALAAIQRCGGFLGPIAVGWGKTLIAALAGSVLGIDTVVILMPAQMLGAFGKELAKIKQQFRTPRTVKLVSYESFSRPDGTDLLERLKPRLIVADEVHALRHASAARTRRFMRYMDAHPEVHFVGVSGTVTSRSLGDYAHLLKYALGDKSPVPRSGQCLNTWSKCVDADGRPGPFEWRSFAPVVETMLGEDIEMRVGAMRTKTARNALQKRLITSEGVVATDTQSCGASIVIRTVTDKDLRLPAEIEEAMDGIDETQTSPDGEDVYEDDVAMWRARRQLSCGFYYRWAWEQVGGRDEEWLARRKQYHRFLREELRTRAAVGYDSPALIARQLDRDIAADPSIVDVSDLHFIYQEWLGVADRPVPPTVPVWLSDYFVDDLVERLQKNRSHTIVWFESDALGNALTERGVRVYGQGTQPPHKSERCAMSIRVHGTGKNLQAWSHNIIAEPPSSGTVVEQMMGRTHRQGQQADEVHYLWYQHTDAFKSALEKAVEGAKYVQESQGAQQKLLVANFI